jgi:hypothetical protein
LKLIISVLPQVWVTDAVVADTDGSLDLGPSIERCGAASLIRPFAAHAYCYADSHNADEAGLRATGFNNRFCQTATSLTK